MKKIKIVLCVVLLFVLCGCSMKNDKKNEDTVPDEYEFLQTNIGKTSEEVKTIIGKDWTDQSYPGVETTQFEDTDGNYYIFHGDRLAAVRYAYADQEQGFQKCRELYEYFEKTYGEELKDSVLLNRQTLKDITTLAEFQKVGNGESMYDVFSNWYFAEDASQWECVSQDEEMKGVWEQSDGKPILILDLWMADDKLSVALGYTGFPK